MARLFVCGVPKDDCTGKIATTDHLGLKGRIFRAHLDSGDALECHAHWLVKRCGFVRLSKRELQSPEGPIRILTKPVRFGGQLRDGKEKTRYMPVQNVGPWIWSY